MLPSETETSKRFLFAGQPKVTDVNPNKDYRFSNIRRMAKEFPTKTIFVFTKYSRLGGSGGFSWRCGTG